MAIIILATLTFGCANPAANKPKATVANAAPESDSVKPFIWEPQENPRQRHFVSHILKFPFPNVC